MKINILALFSGSIGHFMGLYRTLHQCEIGTINYGSHDPILDKLPRNINFFKLKTPPAFVNYEFLLPLSLKTKIQWKAEERIYNNRKKELAMLIDYCKPNILLLDNFNYTDALLVGNFAKDKSIKVVLYQTRLSTWLDSKTMYGINHYKRFSLISSKKIQTKQNLKRKINHWTMPGFDDDTKMRQEIEKLSPINLSVCYKRFGLPSFHYLPELLFSGHNLSYFHADNQHYLGLGLEALFEKKVNNHDSKNIMVSLGSRQDNEVLTNRILIHLQKLINKNKTLTFYLPERYKSFLQGQNLVFYSWLDYSNCLTKADIHISHGGINSIKDSLALAIPLLICPMDWKGDQIHNALFLEKHKLSLTWNILKDNLSDVEQKLDNLMNGKYVDNIQKFVMADREQYPIDQLSNKLQILFDDPRWEIRNW